MERGGEGSGDATLVMFRQAYVFVIRVLPDGRSESFCVIVVIIYKSGASRVRSNRDLRFGAY